MVCKAEQYRVRQRESMKKIQGDDVKGKEPKQEVVRLKKDFCKFKRSCFSEQEDGASAAILLLACVVCTPYST